MVLVATQVKRRRGTTAENDAFTGAEGEITVDLTTHELRVHDGSTVGGHTIPTKNHSYSKTESDNLLSNKVNVALDNLTSVGKEVCANMAMPSNRTVNLTLGSSGSNYTAPADGWFYLNKTSGAQYKQISMINSHCDLRTQARAGDGTGEWVYCIIPASKNDIVRIEYSVTGATNAFRFIYANGAQ